MATADTIIDANVGVVGAFLVPVVITDVTDATAAASVDVATKLKQSRFCHNIFELIVEDVLALFVL